MSAWPRPWAVWTLFKKELLELLRDRRTLFLIYGLPLLAWPVLFGGGGSLAEWRVQKLKQDLGRVVYLPKGLVGKNLAEALFARDTLGQSELTQTTLSLAQREELDSLLRRPEEREPLRRFLEKVNVAMIIVPTPQADHPSNIELKVYCDETRTVSFLSYQALKKRVDFLAKHLLQERAKRRGFPEAELAPLKLQLTKLSKDDRDLARLAALMIPYLAVFILTLAAFNPALQAMVEEKERGTLTTLLTTPIRSTELISGKFMGVLFCSSSSAALHLLNGGILLSRASAGVPGSPELHGLGWLLGVTFSASCVVSAITLFFASLARTNRDGQTLMSVVMLVVLLPAGLINLTEIKATAGSMLLPLGNAALLVSASLSDRLSPAMAIQAMASNLAWTVGILAVTAALFFRLQIQRPGPGARN